MAQQPSSGRAVGNPVPVISPQYCCPQPIDLAIVRKVTVLSSGNMDVKDTNGNILFKSKDVSPLMERRRVLLDGVGNRIVTLRLNTITQHNRWQVFRGESTERRHLIFSAKISSGWFSRTTKLDVFLANNTREDACDFRVVKSSSGLSEPPSCTIYAGESSTIVAQMHGWHTVTVYPNVDYAFIVALILILDEIIHARSSSSSIGGVGGGVIGGFI